MINERVRFQNRVYEALSEDTRELKEGVLLVKTPTNARFIPPHTPYIEASELKHYLNVNIPIIGITGTNGKTTTAALIAHLLQALGHSCALLGTRGFFIHNAQVKPKGLTTPSLLELYSDIARARAEGAKFFVMEVSSHAIAQERILGLEFAAKVHTNITSDHLDYHGDIETYRAIKNQFLSDEGLKIVNLDDPHVRFNPTNAYGYACERKTHLSVNAYSLQPEISAHVEFHADPRARRDPNSNAEMGIVHAPLMGLHNLHNLLGALLCVRALTKQPLESLCSLLGDFPGVEGRMEVVHQNPLVVVDFAHTADGFVQIFNSFKAQKIKVVFGAGGDRDKSKRPLMGQVASTHALKSYITSDNPRSEEPLAIIEDILSGIASELRTRVVVEPDRKRAIELALSELQSDEVLLILGKGDECVQIIGQAHLPFDDRALVRNFFHKD
ncbi:UDP-N-acetylmuramoyl-L-alanyl-D-glutamate--2,6-diaminopimelate ligase [Helicobacter felis]|uniref:UDP-N-acetylmuramoyl-L-alanyl-D-glutamate--2,6-diaminopimelate ligase n=1 Tax=Helicobacter felis (strain ATCC 49179 / CCUG 28539 / NCTC 12436 / CS1) TaxID=936155 RepID=E7A8T9_HELFC|nr:UDP-N-acetylmuramoyl-L-alanyl-D-glutamate--2,6-diaminopimelate ligase [Helicobacter felis]CBY83220.1 UDP-N-acetylmuramoylalanyl-D-glutamate--2,6-dia mi ligase [Helicobacter felis ATCC 49179]